MTFLLNISCMQFVQVVFHRAIRNIEIHMPITAIIFDK